MNLTTKTGDHGTTRIHQQRLDKDHPLIELLGEIDEVMAHFILAQSLYPNKLSMFKERVEELVLITSIVSGFKEESEFSDEIINNLEEKMKTIEASYQGFVYPFDDSYRAQLNLLRTIIRRMERAMVKATKTTKDFFKLRVYVNRLSDYVFILMNQ